MKKLNKIVSAIALAFAAFATPNAAQADGAIVDIRAVDTSGKLFGLRNVMSSGELCSPANPLVAGETFYIRVRMQVENAALIAAGSPDAPLTWKFWDVTNGKWAEEGEGPKLGLLIGGRRAYADYSHLGPNFWQYSGELQYDDLGAATTQYRYYTDFYFKYRVESGDIGMPIRLMNTNFEAPQATSPSAYPYAFLGLNVGSSAYKLYAYNGGSAGSEAELNFAAGGTIAAWPKGPWTGTPYDGPIVSYDLSAEGVYVKTVDFDEVNADGGKWSEGQPWRRVTAGSYDKRCSNPTVSITGGAVAAEDTTVYIWSDNEDVVVPEGAKIDLINVSTAADPTLNPTNRHVLTVTIPKGAASAEFSLRGAPDAELTDSAMIYMTSTKGVISADAAGTLSIVAVSRKITVAEAQPTSVKIRINNLTASTGQVVADANYETSKAQLWVIVEGETTKPITVKLNATINGGNSLSNIYKNNILRLTESAFDLESELSQVTIPAGSGVRHATCYVYALGATDETRSPGIRFTPEIVTADSGAILDSTPAATLKIIPQGEEAIKILQANPADGYTKTLTKTDNWTIRVKFDDSYRNFVKPPVGAPYTYEGYTFKFFDDDTGDEYTFAEGVTPTAVGTWVAVTGKMNWEGFDFGTHPNMYFYGVAPDGSTTEKIKYSVKLTTSVKVVEATTADPTASMTIGEGDTVDIAFKLKSAYPNGYIYLRGNTDADEKLVSTTLFENGAPIDPSDNMSVLNPQQVMYLDGTKRPGKQVTLKAFLASSQNNKTATVAGWEEANFRIMVTNKAPVVKSLIVAGQNCKASERGRQLANVPAGVPKTFELTSVSDVEADWDSMDIRWVIDNQVIEKHGDPTNKANSVTYTFDTMRAGHVVDVEVYVKDKDMSWGDLDLPNYYCTIQIDKQPNVSLSTLGTVSNIFHENATDGSQTLVVKLSEPASSNLTVKLTVGNPANGNGYLRFQHVEGMVETNAVNANEYKITFPAGVTTRELTPVLDDGMDGTIFTASVVINAEVTTTDASAIKDVTWDKYFIKADPITVSVRNDPPQVLRPSDWEVANTNENASINTPYPVKVQVKDVYADFNTSWNNGSSIVKGVYFEIVVDSSTVTNGYLTSSNLEEVNVEFISPGVHTVTVNYQDKDGGQDSRTMLYDVQPAKVLKLYPVGPGAAVSQLGASYATYPGIGAGRVYAGQGPQKVENFVHTYSFLGTQSDVDLWAFGYSVTNGADNGSLLPGPDKGINKLGNWDKTLEITADGYYTYADQHNCGKAGYDSFMYGWLGGAASDDGEAEVMLYSYLRKTGYRSIALPDGSSGNGGSGNNGADKKVTAYPLQKWEAVFSREFLKSDNCGDINLDGIPDLVLFTYGLGIIDPKTKAIVGEKGDIEDASGYNLDSNANPRGYIGESTEGDFLPSEVLSEYGSLIPGLIGTWDTPFTAILEVRGYGLGLNDAFAPNFPDGVANRMVFAEVESDRVYTDPSVDKESTLSKVEWLAWQDFAAANGLAVDNKDDWKKWSPERPTLPNVVDTDGDGIQDGYEYYYWYRAHVGYLDEAGEHHYLTGRKYDPRNPGEGIVITSEEIAAKMDPLVANSDITQDSDNDGLPDLIEMLIGTNPFDFDTDGDGLPDGWEIMIADYNPLLVNSAADGKNDRDRNYDGDAMAITSFKLEESVLPKPFNSDNARFVTFAVLDPNGDTAGVQWYATKAMPEIETNNVDEAAWSFKVDGVDYIAYEEPKLTAEGRLAKALNKGAANSGAFIALSSEEVEEPEVDGDGNPVLDGDDNPIINKVTVCGRGYPVRIEAGAKVTDLSAAKVRVAVITIANEIKADDANACWIYGRGDANSATGAVAATAAEYGCLALARQLAVAKDSELVAMPSNDRDVAFLHYLVYQEFGFDPRTAWKAKDPLASRWGKTINGDALEGAEITGRSGYTGKPTRTRDYAAYDEFLVCSFFENNGVDMSGSTYQIANGAPSLAKYWGSYTTNPQGPNEPELTSLGSLKDIEYYFGRKSTEGADTDGDGVPDGWELYVMAGPKDAKGKYVFAPPYAGFTPAPAGKTKTSKSFFSPFVDAARTTDTANKLYVGNDADDQLNEYEEFEGTDTMAYYADYSTTVVHGDNWKWLNKFFPTDPWNADTDGDGVKDNDEGKTFVYGTPADDGKLHSIPGGGLNPCSMDTDCDGLPDGWERQFKGKTVYTEANAFKDSDGNAVIDFAKDAEGNQVGNALQGLIDGMDGTVMDAVNYPCTYEKVGNSVKTTMVSVDGVRQVVNRDYDNDGLENWQEYLVGTMRCWRYDDPVSQWSSIPVSMYFDLNPMTGLYDWNPKYTEFGLEDGDEDGFWYMTLVDKTSKYYNPHLIVDQNPAAQYFTRVTNGWDVAYSTTAPVYYYIHDRVNGVTLQDLWVGKGMEPGPLAEIVMASGSLPKPSKYISCSPINADTDGDGMDDYYELFHGMNPLLGQSGVLVSALGPCDIVYDAWANNGAGFEAWDGVGNYWKYNPPKAPRGTGFDFEVFPWLNGMQNADPDGDDIRNGEESIMAGVGVKHAWHHTDPTPLWMTDSSYSNSLVNLFFRMQTGVAEVELPASGKFKHGEDEYYFRDFDGFIDKSDGGLTIGSPYSLAQFNPDQWSVTAPGVKNWLFSFEENEGFDTDHDGISDYEELEGKYRAATDPQEADSPRRRQAMYFQGAERPSALQTMPFVKENHPKGVTTYPTDMAFLQYTIECWVNPESLVDSTILERAVCVGESNPGDEEFVRKGFQLGIKNGRWYTKFDPNGTVAGNQVEKISTVAVELNKWTHLAATYDGKDLTLYVNGVAEEPVRSGLQPTFGSSAIAVVDKNYWFDREYALHAIVLGASVKTNKEGEDGYALDVTAGKGWSAYNKFFKGYIDEVRIWDGARKSEEIIRDMSVRYDAEMAAKNRTAFYDQWISGQRRYATDGSSKDYDVMAELRFHWSFDSIFGAENDTAVATSPHGFNTSAKAPLSRPEGYEIPWFAAVLNGYEGTVYNDPAWVTWVPNTVTHLPRFDGTTLDSIFWSADYAGKDAGTYAFANTAEPVSRWTQMLRYGVSTDLRYWTTASRHFLVNSLREAAGNLADMYEFTGRNLNQQGDDLLPLGGAFAKYVTAMWDGNGASTTWEITGTDADSDGLPDWWEIYAEQNYRDGIDPSVTIGWNTVINYNGVSITAGEAFLRDLAQGMYVDANGNVQSGANYTQTADAERCGIPDWWMDMYGIRGESGLDDHDNDGLPNYVEYLLSEVFDFAGIKFSPIKADSVQPGVPDYFYRPKGSSLYVGEIFTDHDLVDDKWEDLYGVNFSSRLNYDAFADNDGDGWSNRSENRYSFQSMPIVAEEQAHYTAADGLVADYPIPTIALKLQYAGARSAEVKSAPIVVQTTTQKKLERDFDATFNIAGKATESDDSSKNNSSAGSSANSNAYTRTIGKWSNRHAIGTLTPGFVNKNSIQLEFSYDPSSEVYSWRVSSKLSNDALKWDAKRGTRAEFDADVRKYGIDRVELESRTTAYNVLEDLELRSDETGKVATWIHTKSGLVLGNINLKTGAFDIDLGVLANQYAEMSSTNSIGKVSLEDQTYRIAYSANPSPDVLPRELYLGEATSGHIREGKNTIIAFADLNGNGTYDAGEPYGCATDVNISWSGTTVEMALSDTTPIISRVDPINNLDDRTALYGTESGNYTNITQTGTASGGVYERVRVVRHLIIGTKGQALASTVGAGIRKVVLDQMMRVDGNSWITEANILASGALDLDWNDLYNDVIKRIDANGQIPSATSSTSKYVIGEVTGVAYRIVMGNEDVNSGAATSNISAIMPVRRFDTARAVPVPVLTAENNGIVTSPSPVFKWTLNNLGSYTVFKVSVTGSNSFSWNSGYVRMPAADENGVITWKAPLFVDDMPVGSSVAFTNNATYSWKVSVYNSKYMTDSYVNGGTFYMNVPTSGYDRGKVDVAVRYFGPNSSYSVGKVRVRAYETPDFSGNIIAAGVVAKVSDAKSGLLSTNVTQANVTLFGLPKGKYYLQAFIDSNNNGVCDDWESSGYYCMRNGMVSNYLNPVAVTFGDDVGEGETVTIYLEDADTDGDGLPDAWEYSQATAAERAGEFLKKRGVELLTLAPAGGVAVNKALTGALTIQANAQVPTAGLAANIQSKMNNAGMLMLAMGVDPAGYDSFSAAISGSVEPSLAEDGVKIAALTMVDGKVLIKVEAETEMAGAAGPFVQVIDADGTMKVNCTVLWKASLSDSVWTALCTKQIVVGADAAEIDLGDAASEASSGFYKVEITK